MWRATWRAHVEIARPDYWFKNVFVIPGIVIALGTVTGVDFGNLAIRILVGLVATCVVASSNYTLNEVLDAPSDLHHPVKRNRAVPSGRLRPAAAYVQWLLLFVAGIGLALSISIPFALSLLALWIMGIVYNVPPVRAKDQPYVDVLSEAINNPLRMLAGWFIVNPSGVVPGSLLLSYWMVGAYFMALKRWAELRHFRDRAQAVGYRKSFAYYTEERLLVSVTFYGSAAMLFLGAFIMRYRIELILAFPLVALVMAVYLSLAFKQDSAAQAPEKLFREGALMTAVIACTVVITILLFVDVPVLFKIFGPTAPTQSAR